MFCSNRIRTVVAMATYNSHRVLMGKEEIDNFYAPNFEKVGSILLSACPFVCAFVRPFKKNLKLGFRNFIYAFLIKKQLTCIFFLSELSPLAKLCPFEGLKVQICNHDISKITTARSFKLGQLLEDDD